MCQLGTTQRSRDKFPGKVAQIQEISENIDVGANICKNLLLGWPRYDLAIGELKN